MAGIPEGKAEAAMARGEGFAKHLGVAKGTDRWNAIVYGTKRKAGWHPSREDGIKGAHQRRMKKMRQGG